MNEEKIQKAIILQELKLQRPSGEMYKRAVRANIYKLKFKQ